MKKLLYGIVVVAVVAAALSTVGLVFAQAPTPQVPVPGSAYGYGGMMGGRSMMGQGQTTSPRNSMMNGADSGLLHDDMIAVYAEKLGLTVDEINTRLANGETMAQITYSKGLTADQFQALMLDARSQAIDQAVKAGTLTQAQADWMKQRGAGMTQAPASRAGMGGSRGMRGAGQGQYANPDCPYFDQTN